MEALLLHTWTYFNTINGTRDSTATTSAASTILSATCSAGRNCLQGVQRTLLRHNLQAARCSSTAAG